LGPEIAGVTAPRESLKYSVSSSKLPSTSFTRKKLSGNNPVTSVPQKTSAPTPPCPRVPKSWYDKKESVSLVYGQSGWRM